MAYSEVLSTSFDKYFDARKMETSEEWLINPYISNLNKISDDGELKEDLPELRSNRAFNILCERVLVPGYHLVSKTL